MPPLPNPERVNAKNNPSASVADCSLAPWLGFIIRFEGGLWRIRDLRQRNDGITANTISLGLRRSRVPGGNFGAVSKSAPCNCTKHIEIDD
jgi:hypothetical protein